jgi:hypothetical protein
MSRMDKSMRVTYTCTVLVPRATAVHYAKAAMVVFVDMPHRTVHAGALQLLMCCLHLVVSSYYFIISLWCAAFRWLPGI